MDFTIVGGLLTALLVAIPTVQAFFQRQTRVARRQNRQLRRLVQEHEIWLYQLERQGWTSRGVRPPERPELLKAVSDDEDGDEVGGPSPRRAADIAPGGGSRHAAP